MFRKFLAAALSTLCFVSLARAENGREHIIIEADEDYFDLVYKGDLTELLQRNHCQFTFTLFRPTGSGQMFVKKLASEQNGYIAVDSSLPAPPRNPLGIRFPIGREDLEMVRETGQFEATDYVNLMGSVTPMSKLYIVRSLKKNETRSWKDYENYTLLHSYVDAMTRSQTEKSYPFIAYRDDYAPTLVANCSNYHMRNSTIVNFTPTASSSNSPRYSADRMGNKYVKGEGYDNGSDRFYAVDGFWAGARGKNSWQVNLNLNASWDVKTIKIFWLKGYEGREITISVSDDGNFYRMIGSAQNLAKRLVLGEAITATHLRLDIKNAPMGIPAIEHIDLTGFERTINDVEPEPVYDD